VELITFSFWSVGSDAVENIDQNKEECDEEGHSTWNNIRRNHETDPRYNNKQT
jgi:hypothetical protein